MIVIVPLKPFAQAKQRLSARLNGAQRAAIGEAMARDVLAALAAMQGVTKTWLLSDEPSAPALAKAYGAQCISETALGTSGLNNSLQVLTRQLAGAPAQRNGDEHMLVIHADLPLLHEQDLQALQASYFGQAHNTLVLAADRHGTGTNAMAFPAHSIPEFRFGPDSFAQHLRQSATLGLEPVVIERQGLAVDLDLPEDLDRVANHCRAMTGPHTRLVLKKFSESTTRKAPGTYPGSAPCMETVA